MMVSYDKFGEKCQSRSFYVSKKTSKVHIAENFNEVVSNQIQ